MSDGTQRQSMADRVKHELLSRIMDGRMAPGQRNVELKIADEMKTSQGPVREALRELEAMDLIITEPYKGTRVREITPKQIEDAYDVRAVLERLHSRRQELDARAREMDIRDSLLKAAEKRVESQVQDLKATESRIAAANEQKSEADAARFKGIVTMYENMKPKDAAKVFDRLDIAVLYQIASQIAPRKLSDIVGQMQPENAERLTVEIARRAGGEKSACLSDLPKIEGRPVN